MSYGTKILADHCNPCGIRLVTWELTYPRFVHAELMTHRNFSRNSASSRAIPTAKMIERIQQDPAGPVWWGKNQSGMQAKEELSNVGESWEQGPGADDAGYAPSPREHAKRLWLAARDSALDLCGRMNEIGLHKQIANRPLEAWMWITVIVSSTKHANWFHLRDHHEAQPEIAVTAKAMHKLYEGRTPLYLPAGEWHLPLLDDALDLFREGYTIENLKLISAGRCARVSYLTHNGDRDPKEDIALAEKLYDKRQDDPMHMSPFEHPAMSMPDGRGYANFHGWKQFRSFIPREAGPPEKNYVHLVPEDQRVSVSGMGL